MTRVYLEVIEGGGGGKHCSSLVVEILSVIM